MREWIKLGTVSAFALTLLAAPAVAASGDMEWDTNSDASISRDEYDAGVANSSVYDEWDANDDGQLSEDEFNEGVFRTYDSNSDDSWSNSDYADYHDQLVPGM